MIFGKTSKLILVGIIVSLALPVTAQSAEKIKTLATFSILGDMVTVLVLKGGLTGWSKPRTSTEIVLWQQKE